MGLAVVNEQDNHDRQRLDSPLFMLVRIMYIMLNMVGLFLSYVFRSFSSLTDESVSSFCRAATRRFVPDWPPPSPGSLSPPPVNLTQR